MKPLVWQARVYFEDTDSGNVVYYANYLKFLERARTEWLRSLGFQQNALMKDHGMMFAVVSVRADYLKPARLDDLLFISCEPQLQRASLHFKQQIRRGSEDGELLLDAEIRVACLDANSFKPRRLPAQMIQETA